VSNGLIVDMNGNAIWICQKRNGSQDGILTIAGENANNFGMADANLVKAKISFWMKRYPKRIGKYYKEYF
jgi:hypothetical protein